MRRDPRPDPDRAPVPGPLPRRAVDRVEDAVAWFLTGAALLVLVFAVLTGFGVHAREAERAERAADTAWRTRAVLLEDAHVVYAEYARMPAKVEARWVDRDGREHVGKVQPLRSQPAGTEVAVWIGPDGEPTTAPAHPASPVIGGFVAAIGVVCAGWTPLFVAWLGVRHLTARYTARRWEEEWARVEPTWRRTLL